ncbi:hypothetical protein FOL46_001188, partial [Perkinsus olseni]
MRGTKSVAICLEEQLVKDAKEAGKRSRSVNVSNMSLEPGQRESQVDDTPGAGEAEGAVARRVNRGRSSDTLGTNSGPMSYAFGVNRGGVPPSDLAEMIVSGLAEVGCLITPGLAEMIVSGLAEVDYTPGSSKAQAADAPKVSRTLDAVEVPQTKGAPVRAGPSAVPAAQVTRTASLVYTTPLGSRDKKRDFGGIVVYGKEVARGGSIEHSLDHLYFWDSQQYYNNRSRLNVLFDLPEILPRNCPTDATTTLRTWLEFWGAEGYHQIYTFENEFAAEYIKNEHLIAGKPRGLVNHIMAMEEEFRNTMYWGFDTSKLAICLWGYVFDLVYKQQRKRELFLCPSVTADVGDVKVTITLSAKGFDELRVHEIEVMGSR